MAGNHTSSRQLSAFFSVATMHVYANRPTRLPGGFVATSCTFLAFACGRHADGWSGGRSAASRNVKRDTRGIKRRYELIFETRPSRPCAASA
jgi:hypothetical protein